MGRRDLVCVLWASSEEDLTASQGHLAGETVGIPPFPSHLGASPARGLSSFAIQLCTASRTSLLN
jgi:hypothetical protein